MLYWYSQSYVDWRVMVSCLDKKIISYKNHEKLKINL